MVATATKKLQIHTALSVRTGDEIALLTAELADPDAFADFRELCASQAVYVQLMTQSYRKTRKAK